MSFGDVLRQTREAQGLTLREVALSTTIRRDYLQALENGQLERLPERPYTRAYLQRYARELQLDPAPLLADFDRMDRAGLEGGEVDPDPETEPETAVPVWGGGRGVAVAALLVLLVLVGALLLRGRGPSDGAVPASSSTASSSTASPGAASPGPATPPTPPTSGEQGPVRLSVSSVPEGARVYLDNRNLGPTPVRSFPVDARARAELRVEAAGHTPLKQTITLGRSRNLRAVLPPDGTQSSLLDLNTGQKTVTPTEPGPTPVPATPAGRPSQLNTDVRITFTGESWALVKDSAGHVLYEGTPPPGKVRVFPAGVTIRAGNAGAVQVSVRGGPPQPLGRPGQVVSRQF